MFLDLTQALQGVPVVPAPLVCAGWAWWFSTWSPCFLSPAPPHTAAHVSFWTRHSFRVCQLKSSTVCICSASKRLFVSKTPGIIWHVLPPPLSPGPPCSRLAPAPSIWRAHLSSSLLWAPRVSWAPFTTSSPWEDSRAQRAVPAHLPPQHLFVASPAPPQCGLAHLNCSLTSLSSALSIMDIPEKQCPWGGVIFFLIFNFLILIFFLGVLLAFVDLVPRCQACTCW